MKRFDLMHQINARGTFMVSKYAIPHLEKAANPHILMLSPPLDMQEKWFAPHTAYTMAKFGMSLVVLGLAGELRAKGIAVNALWPRTTIATAAIKNLLGGDAIMRMSRTPDILADAAYADLREACQKLYRQLPDRRYVPRGRRRHRLRQIPRRSDASRCRRISSCRTTQPPPKGVSLARESLSADCAFQAPQDILHDDPARHPSGRPQSPHASRPSGAARTGCARSTGRSRTNDSRR